MKFNYTKTEIENNNNINIILDLLLSHDLKVKKSDNELFTEYKMLDSKGYTIFELILRKEKLSLQSFMLSFKTLIYSSFTLTISHKNYNSIYNETKSDNEYTALICEQINQKIEQINIKENKEQSPKSLLSFFDNDFINKSLQHDSDRLNNRHLKLMNHLKSNINKVEVIF